MTAMLAECNIQKPLMVEVVRERWDKIVNPLVAGHSRPEKIFKNILYIAADHPTYSNEITMMKDTIIKHLVSEFGYIDIKDVRVEIKRLNW